MPGWDEWNESGGPAYPHDRVVQFCFRRHPPSSRTGAVALDLGCGSGVHTAFLAREGFTVLASDISPVGAANTRARLAAERLDADVRCESADETSFPDGSADVVICIGVLEAAGPRVAVGAIAHARRVLRPGGAALLLFAADDDFRVTGENPYALHGYSQAEVDALTAPYTGSWIDEQVVTYEGGRVRQRDWLVTLQR